MQNLHYEQTLNDINYLQILNRIFILKNGNKTGTAQQG